MFVDELEDFKSQRIAPIVIAQTDAAANTTKLLQVALANEINVCSELAALWMPSTPELDVKLAFARQAGNEAGHFMLVDERLRALGFDTAQFSASSTPMFDSFAGCRPPSQAPRHRRHRTRRGRSSVGD